MNSEASKVPGMAVQALAKEIIDALYADEKYGWHDLKAGMFGPAFSALVRRWAAAEWAQVGKPIVKKDCGEAGCAEGACGTASCLPNYKHVSFGKLGVASDLYDRRAEQAEPFGTVPSGCCLTRRDQISATASGRASAGGPRNGA